MNAGLIAKTVREVWVATLLFAVGMGLAQGLISHILPTFFDQMSEQLLAMPFLQNILKAFLGPEAAVSIGPDMIAAFPWTHPIILILTATMAILFCSRMPAGEVDAGTADVLLGLPVSRMSIYAAESLVWLAAGALLIGFGLLGNVIGALSSETTAAFRFIPRLIAAANLYCLYLAIGGIAWFVSSLGNRRGRVCGVVFAIVLISFLLNFLAPFNKVVERVSVFGLLNYHRPHEIITSGAWPLTDMLVLTVIGGLTWLGGAIVFSRRDIATI